MEVCYDRETKLRSAAGRSDPSRRRELSSNVWVRKLICKESGRWWRYCSSNDLPPHFRRTTEMISPSNQLPSHLQVRSDCLVSSWIDQPCYSANSPSSCWTGASRKIDSFRHQFIHPRIELPRIAFPRNKILNLAVAFPSLQNSIDFETLIVRLSHFLNLLLVKFPFYSLASEIYEFVRFIFRVLLKRSTTAAFRSSFSLV